MDGYTEALKLVTDALRGVCDGVIERDGQGFNKPDSLTVRSHYPDMKAIAPLLLKYKAQIEEYGFDYKYLKEAVIAVSGPLPTWNWNEYKVGFGKHAKLTYKEMAEQKRGYLSWMALKFNHTDPRWMAANAVLSETPIPDMNPEMRSLKEDVGKIRLVCLEGGDIGVQAPFSEKDRCKAISERSWQKPHWKFPVAIIDEVISAFPDGEQSDDFKQLVSWIEERNTKRSDLSSGIVLEHFGNGKTLMPFQLEGIRFIDANGGIGIINDQPGMGKSMQALGILAAHPEWRPAVIVSPAVMKYKWEEEAQAWLETDDIIEVVKNGKLKKLTGDIIIINYDILKKWMPTLKEFNPSIIIFDEIHYLKHAASLRTKAGAELAQGIPHRVGLTGTIADNRPSDLWSPLAMIDRVNYPKSRYFQWHLEFCDGHKIFAGRNKYGKPKMVWDFTGASNLGKLRKSLEPLMIRRTKEDVMPELPDRRRETLIVDIDNRREYNKASKEFLAWIREQNGAKAAEKAKKAEELVRRSYLRRLAIQGKMKACKEWIDNFLLSGEKLIVFAVHKPVIAELMEHYGDIAVKIDGSVTGKAKHDTEQRFQTDPDIKLFIGNIQAAGVGITLTAASDMLFIELDQVPERHNQAECRAHRYTQKRAVNITYAIADKTIDAVIANMLNDKQIVLNKITGDKNTMSFDLFKIARGEDDAV